jgi:hypothetical protein
MKTLLIVGLLLASASPAAAECVTVFNGRMVCKDAAGDLVAPGSAAAKAAPAVAAPAPTVGAAPSAVAKGPVDLSNVSAARDGLASEPVYTPPAAAAVAPKDASAVTSMGGIPTSKKAATKQATKAAKQQAGKACTKVVGPAGAMVCK